MFDMPLSKALSTLIEHKSNITPEQPLRLDGVEVITQKEVIEALTEARKQSTPKVEIVLPKVPHERGNIKVLLPDEYNNLIAEWSMNNTLQTCDEIEVTFKYERLKISRKYSGDSNVYSCSWLGPDFTLAIFISSVGEASYDEIVNFLILLSRTLEYTLSFPSK